MADKPILILDSGGMRNAFVSGVIEAAGVRPEQFSAVYGTSSGAFVSAFFVADKFANARDIWVNQLTSPTILSAQNFLQTRAYAASTDELVRIAKKFLHAEEVIKSHLDLHIGIANLNKGETEFPLATQENIWTLLKSTAAIPGLSPLVKINGATYADGGTFNTTPFKSLHAKGARKILYIANQARSQSFGLRHELFSRAVFRNYPNAQKPFSKRLEVYREELQYADMNADAIMNVFPEHRLPVIGFDRSKTRINKAYDYGLEYGHKVAKNMQSFLQS